MKQIHPEVLKYLAADGAEMQASHLIGPLLELLHDSILKAKAENDVEYLAIAEPFLKELDAEYRKRFGQS